MRTTFRLSLMTGVFAFVCGLANGQQTNPNNLPLCPKNTKAKFHNCWGTYDGYTGEFQDDKFHGIGRESPARMAVLQSFPNGLDEGSWYYGEWKDGLSDGQGILSQAHGTKMEGIWRRGKFIRTVKVNLPGLNDGVSTHTHRTDIDRERQQLAEERPIVGQQVNGNIPPHCPGLGTRWHNCVGYYTYADGVYNGEYRNDLRHGQGILVTKYGQRFEGIFENGNFIREAKVNLPNLSNNIATNTNRADIDRERQQLAEERRRLEEDKRQREQQRRSQRLSLTVSNTQPAPDGSFTINVQTNADTASLKINGNEEGGSQDGRYAIRLIARAGQPTTFNITATDVYGNTDTKSITVNRQVVESKAIYAALNPTKVKKQPDRDAVAVVIGIADYRSLPKAEYANDDARAFYDYAIRALGVKPENIKLLVDGDAEEAEILKTFRTWVPSRVKSTTDVYVYYSGHGLPTQDGQGLYLLPPRADREVIDDTAIPFSKINAALQLAKPRSVTIFMDACYSGQARSGETLVASARPISLRTENRLFPDGFTVITASQHDQISSSSPDLQHGIFSYYLMRGMEGDADANKDGKITLGEMQVYLSENVGRQAAMMSRRQEPQLIGDANRILVGK